MCFVTSTIRAGPVVDASDCLLTLTWPTNSAASWQPAQTGRLNSEWQLPNGHLCPCGGPGHRQVGWPVTQPSPSPSPSRPTNTQTSTIPILINQLINSTGTDIDGILLICCLFPTSGELGKGDAGLWCVHTHVRTKRALCDHSIFVRALHWLPFIFSNLLYSQT